MPAEVVRGWLPNWRSTDRGIRQEHKGMRIEPGFYSSPLEMPPKDAFFQHSGNGNRRKEPKFPTMRVAMQEAIIVYASQKTRSVAPEILEKAA